MTARGMWKHYKLELDFDDKLVGGVPKNPDLIRAWLDSRKPSEVALARREAAGEHIVSLDELSDEVKQYIGADDEAQANKAWVGFKRDAETQALFIDGYHVKAHLKDAANITKEFQNIKALKSKVADRVFVVEPVLYLYTQEGKQFTELSAYLENPVHIMTAQGPRSALKRSDYVAQAVVTATLRVFNDGVVTEKLLTTLLDFGSTRGFGAERGLGHGRYTYQLTEIV